MIHCTYETLCKGLPSFVLQQQMKTTYIERYNKMHLNKKETSIHHKTITQNNSTLFRPLSEISNYEPKFIDSHFQQDPYWNDDLYDQQKHD